ncbi:FG-GAP-like repeat-containing protein [Yinghuangia sp. YIM S09857]|uniref:FG-GAP repeat domain-containing protein n=1 Tax=Yinghuangia sp. YIM S09857 TaxID=3436929 RepID=UPI003F536214
MGSAPVKVMSYNVCGGAVYGTVCTTPGETTARAEAVRALTEAKQVQIVFLSEICHAQFDALVGPMSTLGHRGTYIETGTIDKCRGGVPGRSDSHGLAVFGTGIAAQPQTQVFDFGEKSGGDWNKMLCVDTTLMTRTVKACTLHPSPYLESEQCPEGSALPKCWGTPADRTVRAARQALDPWTAAGVPVIFGGDLNLEPNAPGMDNFYTHSGGSGHFVEADEAGACPTDVARCRDGQMTYDIGLGSASKIDYVLFDDRNFTAVGAEVVPSPVSLSDHGALIGGARWTACGDPAALPGSANPCGGETGSTRHADFDGDGREDIAALTDDGAGTSSLWWWRALPTGSFAPPARAWQSAPGMFTWGRAKVLAGDFTGDGKADIGVLYNQGGHPDGARETALWTFTATGSGFAAPVKVWDSTTWGSWTWAYSKPVAADFTGDGKADLAVVYDGSPGGSYPAETRMFTFASTGAGFAAPTITWNSAGKGSWTWAYSKPVAGDFTGDGKADLVIHYDDAPGTGVTGASSLRLFSSMGTAFAEPTTAWQTPVNGSFRWPYGKPVAADFDGDGKTDVGVLYNGSPENTYPRVTRFFAFMSTSAAFAEPRQLWDSTGQGSWTWASSKPVAGDFTGDGKADLAVAYDQGAEGTALWVLPSNGMALAAPTKWWDSGAWNAVTGKQVAGDFDGDGRTDIAVLHDGGLDENNANHSSAWVFRGTADGRFGPATRVWDSGPRWTWTSSTPLAGDFDRDGKADLAVLYHVDADETVLYTFRSTGTGFEPVARAWEGNGWNANLLQPLVADFTGDGDLDIALLGSQGTTHDGMWLLTGTTAGFAPPIPVGQAPTDRVWQRVHSRPVAGDFTGDGRADVAGWVKCGGAAQGCDGVPDELVVFVSGADGSLTAGPEVGGTRADALVVVPGSGSAGGYLAMLRQVAGSTALVEVSATDGSTTLLASHPGIWSPGGNPLLAGDFDGDGAVELGAFGGDSKGGGIGLWVFSADAFLGDGPRQAGGFVWGALSMV